jgi:hypothetical protein
MAKIEMHGMEAYLSELRKVGEATAPVCEAAVYAGAAVMADAIRQSTEGLDTVSDAEALSNYQARTPGKISVSQKIGLVKSLGITPIRDKYGVFSAKVGFDGYNDVKTKRWPHGQPNQLIARSCESGSTAMTKQPFVRTVIKRTQGAALVEMERAADKKLKKILGGNDNG